MNETMRVAVLVGSLRADSLSRKVARELIERAPKSMRCEIVEIGELALYNEDLDQGAPPRAWSIFRDAMKRADAILFVTPEYNRSIPGCLKNAIDVGSRPAKQSVFDGVPAGVVSVTPHQLGAFGANHALRQTFVFLNMPVMQQPEAYIGNAAEALDEARRNKDGATSKFFEKFMTAFDAWTRTTKKVAEAHDFDAFLQKRRGVASDYVNGKPDSLSAIVTTRDPATFFPPKGEAQRGASTVAARYASDAHSFHEGGTTRLEVLQSGTSGDLAFWTGLQHAEARMSDKGERVPMTLRITEVFRFEDGDFKLVHRHADIPTDADREPPKER